MNAWTWQLKAIAVVVLLTVGAAFGWLVNGWRLDAVAAGVARDHQKVLDQKDEDYARLVAANAKASQDAEARAKQQGLDAAQAQANLSKQSSQERASYERENQRLRDRVATGELRLQVALRAAGGDTPGGGLPGNAGAGGLGNGAAGRYDIDPADSAALLLAAGRGDYYAGQLKYLQGWIRDVLPKTCRVAGYP